MGDNQVSQEVAQYHLHVGKGLVVSTCANNAWYGDECDAGQTTSDHAYGDEIPWRFMAVDEKIFCCRSARCHPCQEDQQKEISRYNGQDQQGGNASGRHGGKIPKSAREEGLSFLAVRRVELEAMVTQCV